jgi:peptidylprolyl isomerase
MQLNMKKLSITCLSILMLLVSYSTFSQVDEEFYKLGKQEWMNDLTTTPSGLKYRIIDQGKGDSPVSGDMVAVHYLGALENDTFFDNSYEREEPLTFNYGVGQVIKGWDEGIGLLKPGGIAFFVIPPKLGYGDSEVLNIPSNSTLYFIVELVDVQKNDKLKAFDTSGKDTVTNPSGVKYIVVQEGEGDKPTKSNWAYFHFTGYLPSGQIFDASMLRGEPVRINPGQMEFIPAWDEIIQMMKPGSKFHVIVPPEMALGEQGLPGVVPPNTTLRFDIELLHVSKKREVKPFDCKGKDTVKLDSGLQIIHVKEGTGIEPKEGDMVKIHFTGYLENGKMFQSSLNTDDPVIFAVGQMHVIKGIDEAVKYLKPGGTMRVLVPWQLGYGEEGYPPLIPEKENLVFDIELLSVVE